MVWCKRFICSKWWYENHKTLTNPICKPWIQIRTFEFEEKVNDQAPKCFISFLICFCLSYGIPGYEMIIFWILKKCENLTFCLHTLYQDGFNIAAIRNYGFIQLIKVHFWFKRIDFISRFRLISDFRVRFITKKDERPYLAYHINFFGAKTYNLWQTTRPFPN